MGISTLLYSNAIMIYEGYLNVISSNMGFVTSIHYMKGLFCDPFETGTKALRMFIIIYLILFHVMVSLASLMKVSSIFFFPWKD